MEREKKLWSEMTEAERQVVRESWKHALPDEFDVFCIGNMIRTESEGDLIIPGNLYVSGYLDVFGLVVGETVVVDNYIDAGKITVKRGSCICSGDVTASDISVSNGNFISNGDIDICDITVQKGHCIVGHYINSYTVNIDGVLDCYDIESNGHKIHATDYSCRYYYEEF